MGSLTGKRIFIGFMVLVLSALIMGCASQATIAGMRIQSTILTENETAMIELIQASEQSSKIFDYNVDSNVKSAKITTYMLGDNGKWETRYGPSSFLLEEPTGRIAISFGNIDDGMKIAIQYGGSTVGSEMNSGQKSNLSEMGRYTSFADIADIEYGKEIPLAMQVFTSALDTTSGQVDDFFKPENLRESGYEEVFVLVIEFSKEGLQ